DFSQGALDPATFNAILRGIPIKFVTHLSLNRTDQVSSGLLIRQDLVDGGRFRELPDVKGMTIAIGPGTGSSAEMYLSRVLASVGLTIADVDPVTMSYPDAATALVNRGIDASWHIQPFITNLEARGVAKMVAPLAEFYPGAVTNTLMIGPGFAQREP